jgi:hypothetical protein
MVSGGLMQLFAYGAQDAYLTGNSHVTYFKTNYRRHTNFATESIENNNLHYDENQEEENDPEYIEIDHLVDLEFDVDDKCCVCNNYLLTENMECFLFNKYGDDKFLHHGCKDGLCEEIYDEDYISNDIYDIEKIHEWIDINREDEVDEDNDENNNDDEVCIEI